MLKKALIFCIRLDDYCILFEILPRRLTQEKNGVAQDTTTASRWAPVAPGLRAGEQVASSLLPWLESHPRLTHVCLLTFTEH